MPDIRDTLSALPLEAMPGEGDSGARIETLEQRLSKMLVPYGAAAVQEYAPEILRSALRQELLLMDILDALSGQESKPRKRSKSSKG